LFIGLGGKAHDEFGLGARIMEIKIAGRKNIVVLRHFQTNLFRDHPDLGAGRGKNGIAFAIEETIVRLNGRLEQEQKKND